MGLVYGTYAEAAIRTAFLITRNKAAAEDAVQEAFVQVIRSISTLRDPASFRPWFYRIVVNAAKRLSRNANRSLPLDLEIHNHIDLSVLPPDEAAIGIEEIQMLRSAVNDLNEAHREAIILRYYTGLSDEEIAQTLGVPSGTVKSRLHRAREALHERLEGTVKPATPGNAAVQANRIRAQKE
jgi:RNA polymerase sigma-70 factor (ECF subfamily)